MVTILVGLPIHAKGQPPELPLELSAEQILQFAHRLFSQQEYFRALGEYQRFLLLFPDNPEVPTAALRIVQCYSRGKHWQEALEAAGAFLRAHAQSPLRWQARFLKARALMELNRTEEAREAYREIIKARPGKPLVAEAWYRIGLSYAREQRWLEADEALGLIGSESLIYDDAEAVRQILLEASKTKRKDPTLAGVLALVPGAGHIYCERPRDAALAFLFTGAFAWATVEAFNQNHDELGIALGLVTLALYAGNIFSAVNVAHKFNDREERRLQERLAPYERGGIARQQNTAVRLALKFYF
jgi:tetratricopeptide (TPR) repeat protein